MQKELLTNEQLRLAVEKTWIEHIKLCQDNFLYFVTSNAFENSALSEIMGNS